MSPEGKDDRALLLESNRELAGDLQEEPKHEAAMSKGLVPGIHLIEASKGMALPFWV